MPQPDGPDQRDELAVLDRQRDVVDGRRPSPYCLTTSFRTTSAIVDPSAATRPRVAAFGCQALTAPSVSARTKYFCSTRNITTTGTLMMNDAGHQAGPVGRVLGEEPLQSDRQRHLLLVVDEGQRIDVLVPGA